MAFNIHNGVLKTELGHSKRFAVHDGTLMPYLTCIIADDGYQGMSVKVGSTWKTATKAEVKVSGTWKEAVLVQVNVGGVWKTVHEI